MQSNMLLDFLKKPLVLTLALLGYGCFPLPAQRGEFTPQEFESMSEEMASKKVKNISPNDIQSSFVLLDTREEKEYEVSHIESAKYAGYDDINIDKLIKDLDPRDTIVVYCSVGYRSGKIGEKLQKKGFQNVFNLKGGLFRWANEDRKLVNEEGQPTNKVHGFNEKWSKWLKKEVEAVF